MRAIPLRPTWMRNVLLPRLTLKHAKAAQILASGNSPFVATVEGYTTPAVADVGGASVRLRFPREVDHLESGGYLVCVRSPGAGAFLPAIAGVPWEKGMDRHGQSRQGLGELMVLARPVCEEGGNEKRGKREMVTFLHEQALCELYRTEDAVDVVILAQLTDFFLGLNAVSADAASNRTTV